MTGIAFKSDRCAGTASSVCADGSCRHWLRAAPGKAGIRNRVRCDRSNRPLSLRTVPEITHVRIHGELFTGPASAGRFRPRPPLLTPHGDAARPASGPPRAREKTLRMALRDNPGSRPPNGSTGPQPDAIDASLQSSPQPASPSSPDSCQTAASITDSLLEGRVNSGRRFPPNWVNSACRSTNAVVPWRSLHRPESRRSSG